MFGRVVPYPKDSPIYNKFRSEIIQEFKFNDNITSGIRNIFKSINHCRYRNCTFVGVDVETTGDENRSQVLFGCNVITVEYLAEAMEYLQRKYRDVVFIITCDVVKWCQKYLQFIYQLSLM